MQGRVLRARIGGAEEETGRWFVFVQDALQGLFGLAEDRPRGCRFGDLDAHHPCFALSLEIPCPADKNAGGLAASVVLKRTPDYPPPRHSGSSLRRSSPLSRGAS